MYNICVISTNGSCFSQNYGPQTPLKKQFRELHEVVPQIERANMVNNATFLDIEFEFTLFIRAN